MVNVTLTSLHDPLRDLALSYAPADRRAGLEALFALDAALGQVLRTTREPMVGQMRLAWWREALAALDTAPPPAEPVLQALAAVVLPRGVAGRQLARLADGWEQLLSAPLDVSVMQRHAVLRGANLFELSAMVCGVALDRRYQLAGRGWAFADLAGHLSDPALSAKASEMAKLRLPRVGRSLAGLPWRWRLQWWLQRKPWPRRGRALGALALVSAHRVAGRTSARIVWRLARFRLTGH